MLRSGGTRTSFAHMNPSTTERTALPFARYAALSLVALSLTSAVLVGCGGSKSESTTETTTETTTTTTPEPAAGAADPTAAPATEESGEAATAALFKTRCALCHGPDGHGNGPGAAALKPAPRNFHDKAYMSTRTDAQLSEVIHQGKGAMPKWGGILTDDQITGLIKHIRELGEKP